MSTPIVSMDEAGQTGQNLLDKHQPLFTLASVDLTENEAFDLIGRGQGELHFVNAKKRPAGRARVIELLNALTASRVKAVTIDKQFMVTCKMIDQLVEPLMHEDGIDGYADGSLLALANFWHLAFDSCVGPTAMPDLQRLFVHAIHRRDQNSVDEFYTRLDAAIVEAKIDIPCMEAMQQRSRPHFEALLKEQALPTLEPGVPAAQALVYEWATVHPNGFEVRHDERNEVDQWIKHLTTYYGLDQPPTDFTFPNGATIRLPVPVTTFRTGASHQHPAIQVADIVASAANYLIQHTVLAQNGNEFAEELSNTPILDFIITTCSIWPNPELLETPPTPGPVGEFDRLSKWASNTSKP